MIQGAWWTRSGAHEDVPTLGGIGPRPPRTSRRPRRAELSGLVKRGGRGSRPGDTASRAVPRPMAAHQLPACPGGRGQPGPAGRKRGCSRSREQGAGRPSEPGDRKLPESTELLFQTVPGHPSACVETRPARGHSLRGHLLTVGRLPKGRLSS